MDFVKREEQYTFDEESYKLYIENLQKSQQIETSDYQHTPISMEQLHQVMQSSLNSSSIVHNFQLPLSPRQMSTLMLKTNHLSRNLNFNELPHLPRNLEMDLVHNLANELPQNFGRHEDIISQNLRAFDMNLARHLSHEIELQNSLNQSNLIQNLTEHDLNRINEINMAQNIIRDSEQDMGQQINLTQHINREVEQELLNQEQRNQELLNQERRSPIVVQCVPDSHLIDQSIAHRLDQSLSQRLEQVLPHNLIQRFDPSSAHRLELPEAPRNMDQEVLPSQFHIKSEQEDDGYFYDDLQQGLDNVGAVNGNLPVQSSTTNIQENLYSYNSHIPNISTISNIDLYRTQNYVQNYVASRDDPQNLVVNKTYENTEPSPYTPEEFKKLQETIVPKTTTNSHDKEEKIDKCNDKFYNEFSTIQYVNSGKNENDSSAQNKLSIEEISMNIKGEYMCYKCNNIFPSKRGLKQHMKACLDEEELENNEKQGKFCCSQCAYRCQSPAILKIHERIHSGEKPFSCTFCDYKSGQKNNVAKHILVHMKEKPFKCQYCDYRCAQKNNLVVHERTHTGFKPFGCPYCSYRTVQKPNLVKHMYLHTDQKPFSCDMCSYRCVQKTNLTKHKQRHLNEKEGDKIDVKVQTKPYRPRQKSVKCQHCPYRCVQKSSLEKHMQFKHNEFNLQDTDISAIHNNLDDNGFKDGDGQTVIQNSVIQTNIQNGAENEDSQHSDYSNYSQENFAQGLNLMKNSDIGEEIQNLSVKKDSFPQNLCHDKIEPLQLQS